jgi:hypothetical protein
VRATPAILLERGLRKCNHVRLTFVQTRALFARCGAGLEHFEAFEKLAQLDGLEVLRKDGTLEQT